MNSQGTLSPDNYGRDHHPGCFTKWMAGAGAKPGFSYGETDDFGYIVVKDRYLYMTYKHPCSTYSASITSDSLSSISAEDTYSRMWKVK